MANPLAAALLKQGGFGQQAGTIRPAALRLNMPRFVGRAFRTRGNAPGIGFDISVKMFFDRKNVIQAVGKKERVTMIRAGAVVRTIARRSLRVAPRVKVGELFGPDHVLIDQQTGFGNVGFRNFTSQQHVQLLRDRHDRYRHWRRVYSRLNAKANRGPLSPSEMRTQQWAGNLRRTQFPRRTSMPGQQPYIRWAGSPLKGLIYFGYDAVRHSVVIGPQLFRNVRTGQVGDADTIEYGGRSRRTGSVMAARPFMRPALRVARTRYMHLFKDFIN